jgi:hypothetical protein
VEIIKVNDQEYHVVETSYLKVGNNYRLNSSYGYAGVNNGIVKIVNFLKYGVDNISSIVDTWVETESHMRIDEKDLKYLKEEPWIEYEYYNEKLNDVDMYLPMRLFLQLTSII